MIKDLEFEKYLNQLADPNYQGGSWFFSDNATPLEKTKYELCREILIYQLRHKLTDEELAKKINLTLPETQNILYHRVANFNFNRLLSCANKLDGESQVIWISQPRIQQDT